MKRRPSTGPNLAPLQDYLMARDSHAEGKEPESLTLLSRALGADKPLERLSGSLREAFRPTSPMCDMLLGIVLTETKKKGGDSRG